MFFALAERNRAVKTVMGIVLAAKFAFFCTFLYDYAQDLVNKC